MTEYQKFEETAALVELWRKQQKPKIKKYGCEKCRYCQYTSEEYGDGRFHTYSYCVCNCLPNWRKPVARIGICPKQSNPNAGSLRSVCHINK